MEEYVSLSKHTTFKLGGPARYFFRVKNVEEAREALGFARQERLPFFVLGGGSNLLVSDDGFSGVVIKNEISGVSFEETGEVTHAKVGAGESWDAFVAECVRRGLYGVENLSGIPGTVGAAPIQNIGAYGAEVKEVIDSVEALDSDSGEVKVFRNAECGFAYRDSFFKTPEGKRYVITNVTFHLQKRGLPNLEYKDLQKYFYGVSDSSFLKGGAESAPRPSVAFGEGGRRRILGTPQNPSSHQNEPLPLGKGELPTLADVRKAVLEIRRGKFPDLNTTGTAGSFFKNPIIPQTQYDELKKKFPLLPCFPLSNVKGHMSNVKVPLAWILDNILHLKGFGTDGTGLHDAQPLVLVNTGGASAADIRRLAEDVAAKVKSATGIDLEWEVQML